MADIKPVIVPLNGKNYPTWKIQCRMALVKDNLWSIVSETEECPTEREPRRKFIERCDKALAIIVLMIDPKLIYLLGADPTDPVVVWKRLEEQFQRKTWANKLHLRRKLFSLRLKEGGCMSQHIKALTEIFDELSVIGDIVSEEDKVVYLLASLPDSYNMLVTSLEVQETVPKWRVATERLLHEETKMKEKTQTQNSEDGRKVFVANQKSKFGRPPTVTCHYCRKPGHFMKDCRKLQHKKKMESKKEGASLALAEVEEALMTSDAEKVICTGKWIVDSGATCHMCNDHQCFTDWKFFDRPKEVTLGDGHSLHGTAEGTVKLETLLPDGGTKKCRLENVLYVPDLSYCLLSVSKVAEAGKTTKFSKLGCEILTSDKKVMGFATKVGNLYHLECCHKVQHVNTAVADKEQLWHRRFGHIGEDKLKGLANKELVECFDYDSSKSIGFCECCIGGKQHRTPFVSSSTEATELLELIHSDVCGKISEKSIGGAQYFLTFTDHKSRYTWTYFLKSKDEVFNRFIEWKALVENATGKSIKVLRTDNGGEYTSTVFQNYLKKEGIRHELTIPKTPEQNGVAERLNRTLVEMARSMLLDGKLKLKFWAEAVSTAVYLKNRTPSSALKITPYEAWHGSKPKVDHLRVFGCDAFAHIPKDERSKFNSKTRKCIMVGYGDVTKGYRLYDLTSEKVIHSRDVKFNEQPKQEVRQVSMDTDDSDYKLIADFEETSNADDSSHHDELECQSCEPEQLRRSTRVKKPPDYFVPEHTSLCDLSQQPSSYDEAINGRHSEKWQTAMESELSSLQESEAWDLVKLPEGNHTVGSKWVYKVKIGPDGSVQRYKARLVAQGFTQKYGTDFDETFSPVVRLESLRMLIAKSVQHDLQLHQLDVTTAFLNGTLKEEVYMEQPKGFVCQGKEELVCKLKKSLYGLKQAPRCWNSTLDSYLKTLGFIQTVSDPCIYFKTSDEDTLYLGVYVDDIVIAGKGEEQIQQLKDNLAKKFNIKDLGQLKYFLGINVVQNQEKQCVWIGQPTYTENLLQKFGMQDSKPVNTPVESGAKLHSATEEDELVDQVKYQSAIGSLMYLAVSTRPDIAYAVNSLAKFNSKPSEEHWTALKRVFRYLKGTLKCGILYQKDDSETITGYSDADWAGDTTDRKSISGYVFMQNGGAISWSSRKQKTVALSTAEAEYLALSNASQECMWLRQLQRELNYSTSTPTIIYEDNQATIAMAKNPKFHGRAKHIDIRHHFIREQVAQGTLEIKYCPTTEMVADFMTKGLSCEKFVKQRVNSGLQEPPP